MGVLEKFYELLRSSTDMNALKDATLQLEQFEKTYEESGMNSYNFGSTDFRISSEDGQRLYEINNNGNYHSVSREKMIHAIEGEINPSVLNHDEYGGIMYRAGDAGTLKGRLVYDSIGDDFDAVYTWSGRDNSTVQYYGDDTRSIGEWFEGSGITEDNLENILEITPETPVEPVKLDSPQELPIDVEKYTPVEPQDEPIEAGNETYDVPNLEEKPTDAPEMPVIPTEEMPNAADIPEVPTEPTDQEKISAVDAIKNVATENYNQASKTAWERASKTLDEMRATESTEPYVHRKIEDQWFAVNTGTPKRFFYTENGQYVETDPKDIRERIKEALMDSTRRELDRDADAVVCGESGYVSVTKNRDDSYTYRYTDWDGNARDIPKEQVEDFESMINENMDRRYVQDNTVRSSEAARARREADIQYRNITEGDRTAAQTAGKIFVMEEIARNNFERLRRAAERSADGFIKNMERNTSPGNPAVSPYISEPCMVYHDENGNYRYFAGADRQEYTREELRQRLINAHVRDTREREGRDADFIIGTAAGIVTGNAHLDQRNEPQVEFSIRDENGTRPIEGEELERAMDGLSDEHISENNRKTVVEAEKDRENIKMSMEKDRLVNSNDLTYEFMSKAHDMEIDRIAEKNEQPKRALREALRIATENNNNINKEVNRRLKGVLEKMEKECPNGEERTLQLGGQTFTVGRNEAGELYYKSGEHEFKRNAMRKAMFTAEKREVVNELKEKGQDELAIVPLNEKHMLVIRTADLENEEKNAFEDGNKNFNFYLRDEDGNEKQLTQRHVNRIFKENGIESKKDIDDRITTNYNKAKMTMANIGKAVGRTAAREVKRGLEFATLKQAAAGFQMGEEMARF